MSDDGVKQLSTYERLSARFPVESHKKVNKGGSDQTYVPAVDIFDRVDEVLGMTGWQARVIREGLTATEAWVLAEVTATIDGVEVVRQQYGCESITVGRDAKPVGDLFKKAATDAYKKCLTLMGVARYLYDADERREVEQEMRQARQQPKPPTGKPVDLGTVRKAAELMGATPATPSYVCTHERKHENACASCTACYVLGRGYEQHNCPPGAKRPNGEDFMKCVVCEGFVAIASKVDIQRNPAGQRRLASVAEFAPVCIERLGGFHCGPCYDKKYWKKGA